MTVFASETASKNERAFLCGAVDSALELNQADMGLDVAKCLKNRSLKSTLVTEGVRTVSGTLTFHSPSRPTFTLNCTASYYASPELENVVGGIEAVTCE